MLFSNYDLKLLTDAHFHQLKQLLQVNKIFLSSCGSLKSRQGVGSGFWDILSDKSAPITILSQREVKAGSVGPAIAKPGELTLTLTSVSAPLSLLHLQSGTSRFWLCSRNNWYIPKIAWSSLYMLQVLQPLLAGGGREGRGRSFLQPLLTKEHLWYNCQAQQHPWHKVAADRGRSLTPSLCQTQQV